MVDASGHKLQTNTIDHVVCINSDDSQYRHQIEIDEYSEEQLEDDNMETAHYERMTTNKSNKNDKNVYVLSGPSASTSTSSADPIQTSRQMTKYITEHQSSQHNDSDERFLLSCSPILKRLSNKKNALARLKIQQLLFDIEFDEYSEVGNQ